MRRVVPVLLLGFAACTVAPPGGSPAPEAGALLAGEAPLPPPGYGTLRQDDVSVTLRSGSLQIKVTPLLEAVLITTAPDTYRRLHGLAVAHGPEAARAVGGGEPDLFLVSFFSDTQGTTFEPEALNLVSQGLRRRPDAVVAVTPSWGERRLRQRATEMAIYAFADGVDLESDLVVLYGPTQSSEWTVIRSRVRTELERVRARARGGQSSSSYLEIFR